MSSGYGEWSSINRTKDHLTVVQYTLYYQCRPRRSRGWHWFSRGDNFPCYPHVQSIFIILYWMLIKYIVYIYVIVGIHGWLRFVPLSWWREERSVINRGFRRCIYVWFQNNPGQVNIWVCISYSVNSNAHLTPVKIYGEPYAHKLCAVNIFLENHPSSSNITSCQVPSRVRAWFDDSADIIDFYQMSLRQSESTILHESIIS